MNLKFEAVNENGFWDVKEMYERNDWQSFNREAIIYHYDEDSKTYLVFDEYSERDGETYIEDFKTLEDMKNYYNTVARSRLNKRKATA